ncbi:MAG: nucleotide exchange factor GrpE [Flavobacteriales bacterium]
MKSEEIENTEANEEQVKSTETASEETTNAEQTDNQSAEQPELADDTKMEKELAEWKDKYTRLFAEFDNFRKRTAKERIDLISSSTGDVLKELLPVIDDFDRAVKANESTEDVNVIKEGFVLIHHKLYKKLESKGLTPINAQGKPFDTDFHEAITSIPAPSEDLKGKVVDEVEKGYLLNDKVLRFSKVVIGQ